MDLKEIVKTGSFDLHMHTTASDGDYPPEEVVAKAKAEALQTIAVTDHDTLEGIEEAVKEGRKLGVTVIPGVELSTKEGKKSVDILGYGLTHSAELETTLARMREGRENRAERIVAKFSELNMPLSMEDVRKHASGGVIARPHIAKAVVEKGYIADVQSVFDDYLADGKPCALPKVVLTPKEGIDLIHKAGGKAVLAHPVHLHDDELVRHLLETYDFDGLEVWHREQDEAAVERYREMANHYGLLMTGGSDFHHDQHRIGRFGYSDNSSNQ
ncbi:MAG TPA: PHP domain-containing protein [Bacillales bacterium]|nr:PHP domain-containing protein [Bacillales bacterium]